MKYIFFILFSLNCFAQTKVTIASSYHNILTFGFDNPIEISVDGYRCKDLIIKTNNGKIEGDKCYYNINPEREGEAKIDIYFKNKLIGSRKFRVYKPEYYTLFCCSEYQDQLIYNRISSLRLILESPSVQFGDYDLDYQVIIVRGNELLYNGTHAGRKFDEKLMLQISKVQVGDVLIFNDILLSFNNQKNIKLPSICDTVKFIL